MHDVVLLSTTEAEYVALLTLMWDVIYFMNLINEMKNIGNSSTFSTHIVGFASRAGSQVANCSRSVCMINKGRGRNIEKHHLWLHNKRYCQLATSKYEHKEWACAIKGFCNTNNMAMQYGGKSNVSAIKIAFCLAVPDYYERKCNGVLCEGEATRDSWCTKEYAFCCSNKNGNISKNEPLLHMLFDNLSFLLFLAVSQKLGIIKNVTKINRKLFNTVCFCIL